MFERSNNNFEVTGECGGGLHEAMLRRDRTILAGENEKEWTMLTRSAVFEIFISMSTRKPLKKPHSASGANAAKSSVRRTHEVSDATMLLQTLRYRLAWSLAVGFLMAWSFCKRNKKSSYRR